MSTTCVCEGGGLRATLRADRDRYIYGGEGYSINRSPGEAAPLVSPRVGITFQLLWATVSQRLWATAAYRVSHYCKYRLHSRLLAVIAVVVHRLVAALTGIQIDPRAHIGHGLLFPHGGYIVIGPVRMGSNCNILQGVTLGEALSTFTEAPTRQEAPIVGDRVWIGPGAVVAGPVTIGNDAAVGANSLLVRDVPDRGVMIGVPARLVSRKGSFSQIRYRDMDRDHERRSALMADPEKSPDLIQNP